MRFQYCVLEVSDTNWQEIMDSDEGNEANQHLNHWGGKGWEMVTVVPKTLKGTTMSYAIVFKKPLAEGETVPGGCGKAK